MELGRFWLCFLGGWLFCLDLSEILGSLVVLFFLVWFEVLEGGELVV